MFRYLFVLAALAPAMINGIKVVPCPNNAPTPLSVGIKGCTAPPCILSRGDSVIGDIEVAIPTATGRIAPKVVAHALGSTVVFEMPEEQQNACDHLLNAACPLDAGEEVIYRIQMPISEEYPLVDVGLELSVIDEDNDKILACFVVPITVVA